MIRRISYRSAVTAFVFTGLWFVIGALLLWSPIPGALGIRGEMFVAWLALFLTILAGAGATLTIASYNGIFPPDDVPAPAKKSARIAAPVAPAPTATDTHTADGKPQPWTQSPLPDRPARRPLSTTTRPSSPGQPPARPGR